MIENKAAILEKVNVIEIKINTVPQPKENEVLIHVDCVGICGSDVHYWNEGVCGLHHLDGPLVLGHEGSGIIEQVGSKVKELKVGDRVAIEPSVPCRQCDYCHNGRYNVCKHMKYLGCPGLNGALTSYFVHPADFCYKIADNVSMEEATMVQPLSVALHAWRRAVGGGVLGPRVLVLGSGPIGLLVALVAKTMGAVDVLVTDILESRLNFAKKVGINKTLLVRKDEDEKALKEKIHKAMENEPNLTFDATGDPAAVRLAMMVTKTTGCIMLIGLGYHDIKLPIAEAVFREVDIKGIIRFCNVYPQALDILASGLINLKPFITHHFDLNDTEKALEKAKSGEGIKVIIHVQQQGTNNNE